MKAVAILLLLLIPFAQAQNCTVVYNETIGDWVCADIPEEPGGGEDTVTVEYHDEMQSLNEFLDDGVVASAAPIFGELLTIILLLFVGAFISVLYHFVFQFF